MLVLLLCLLLPIPVPSTPWHLPLSSCTSLQLSLAVHQPFVQHLGGWCCVPHRRQPPPAFLVTFSASIPPLLTCLVRETTCNVLRRPRATAMSREAKHVHTHVPRNWGVSARMGCICLPSFPSSLSHRDPSRSLSPLSIRTERGFLIRST